MANQYRNYDPTTDSCSARLEGYPCDATTGPHLYRGTGDCYCGCGQPPQRNGGYFRMGHDARYRGILLRAHVAGMPVSIFNGNEFTTTSAMWLAQIHGWGEALQTTATREQARAYGRAAKAKTKAAAKATRLQIGDITPINVGRWTYQAQVVGLWEDGTAEYEYTTKQGATKRSRQPIAKGN